MGRKLRTAGWAAHGIWRPGNPSSDGLAAGPHSRYGRHAMEALPLGLAPPPAPAPDEFWDALGPGLRAELAAMARRRTYARGQALFHRGQLPDQVLVLASGRVKVTMTTEEGREVVLAFRRPGALIGEQAALDRGARA